jgi:hypothetical protein
MGCSGTGGGGGLVKRGNIVDELSPLDSGNSHPYKYHLYVRFQVLTAASIKFRFVFWDVLSCKKIINRRFRGTCDRLDDEVSMYL